jgi:general secretion pathway protein A
MYQAHWQLERRPFEAGVDTSVYYPAESHQASLLKLRYTIENARGAALLAGGPGLGKTMLVKLLWQQLSDQFAPLVHLVFPQMPTAELLAYLAAELTGSPQDEETAGAPRSIESSVRSIERCVLENAAQGRHAVIAVDEAHLLEGGRTLEALRLLLNFESDGRPALTLLLVGQPTLLPGLARMPQLEAWLAVKCLLRPLTLEETMGYVQHRLAVAGAQRTIFEPAAVELVHQVSEGVPRRINRVCDLALLLGFAEEHAAIGPAQIESVSQELAVSAS